MATKFTLTPAPGGPYTSPVRLYLTADDEVVGEDDPRAHRLLVGAGGTVPAKLAARYHLTGAPSAPDAPSAQQSAPAPVADESAPQDVLGASEDSRSVPAKAVSGPANTKALGAEGTK